MKTLEIVFVGDTHFESLNNLFGEQGDDYIFQCFQNAVDYATTNNVVNIIQLGDIFDRFNPDEATVVRLLQFCMHNHHHNFYFIIGNHDIKSINLHSSRFLEFVARARLLPNLFIYTTPELKWLDGVPIYFMPWPALSHEALDHPCLNIAHIKVPNTVDDGGRKLKNLEIDELPDTDDWWIIGDLHTYQRPGPRIIYPGTMFQKNFGETLPKGFVHSFIKYSNKQQRIYCKHKYVQTDPPFVLENVIINSAADFRDLPVNNTRYKLIKKVDIEIPNTMLNNPNVVSVKGFENREELKAMLSNEIVVVDETMNLQKNFITQNLDDFLKVRGLTPKQIHRAYKLVDAMVNGE